MDDMLHDLVIVGAGPAGLECALAARERGLDVLVLERGRVGEHMLRWGFVELFTPWAMNVTPRGLEHCSHALEPTAAHDARSFVESYLRPIAQSDVLRGRVHEGITVRWIGRSGTTKSDLIGDPSRAKLAFVVLAEEASGQEQMFHARAVVDASGVFQQPRRLGDGGIPALGERQNAASIAYHVEALHAEAIEGRRFAVFGAGYSAATMLEQFVQLRSRARCQVDWCISSATGPLLAPIANDPLPARRRLSELAARLARQDEPNIRLRRGVRIVRVERRADGLHLHTVRAALGPYDRVFAMVGYAPDLSLSDELQFHACYATQGPMRLAAQLLAQGAQSDCLQLGDAGADSLSNPEPGFFVLGAKSYGRNPDFLLARLPAQIEAVLDQIVHSRLVQ